MALLCFKFKNQFVKGTLNILPDMLNCNPSRAEPDGDLESLFNVFTNSQALSEGPLLVIADTNVLPPSEEDYLLKYVLYYQ